MTSRRKLYIEDLSLPEFTRIPTGKNRGYMLGHMTLPELGWYATEYKNDKIRAAAKDVIGLMGEK